VSTKRTILLIDDNHNTLDLLELFLFKSFTIIFEENGFGGLKRAQEELPDLIITDIMMPVMDGIKFINSLRKSEKAATIPVLAVTSFTKENNIKSLLSVGFTGVIVKPFTVEAVRQAIETVFGPSGQE
jgi:CheY-like chemotaxis protein